MNVTAVILARAGSKGLEDKCMRLLCGREMLAYTIGHAQQSQFVDTILLTTDSEPATQLGRKSGIVVIGRPSELTSDTARVDSTVRDAILVHEADSGSRPDIVVVLYANVPIRADGIIDRCVAHLIETGADSVRTLTPITKQHPDWLHRLEGDRMIQYRRNSIHRRQDLEPLYYHDSAVIAVTRDSLFAPETKDDPHAFFGRNRRAVVQAPEDTVDVDTLADLYEAEANLRLRSETLFTSRSRPVRGRPILTGAVGYALHARR